MRLPVSIFAVLLAIGGWLASPASGSRPSIGLYFDPDGTTCSTSAAVGVPIALYVNAQLGAPAEAGIAGAEFSVHGIPADWWILDVTPNPAANLLLGNPMSGCHIAFSSCQSSSSGYVSVCVIRILPVSSHSDIHLQVHPGSWYCNPFCCPILLGCDAPVYTRICVVGGEAFVNGQTCTVRVAPSTWGRVKQLYQ